MGRYHCYEHGIEYNSVCPACRDEKAEEDRQEIIDGLSEQTKETKKSLEDMAYKQANPGDYQCPECLYITLKKSASRCPTCRSSISTAHWERVLEQERVEKERAAKILAEFQAEQRAAREAAQEVAKKVEQRAAREKLEAEERQNDEFKVALMLLAILVLVSIMILSPVPPAIREIVEIIRRWIS